MTGRTYNVYPSATTVLTSSVPFTRRIMDAEGTGEVTAWDVFENRPDDERAHVLLDLLGKYISRMP